MCVFVYKWRCETTVRDSVRAIGYADFKECKICQILPLVIFMKLFNDAFGKSLYDETRKKKMKIKNEKQSTYTRGSAKMKYWAHSGNKNDNENKKWNAWNGNNKQMVEFEMNIAPPTISNVECYIVELFLSVFFCIWKIKRNDDTLSHGRIHALIVSAAAAVVAAAKLFISFRRVRTQITNYLCLVVRDQKGRTRASVCVRVCILSVLIE